MIVDTSALVCILRGEPQEQQCRRLILNDPQTRMSAATFVELGIVVERKGNPVLIGQLDGILDGLGIEVSPVTASQARLARGAYRDFGKAMGQPAQLNFGDCFSYALAKESREPLLFVGEDFRKTDIVPAL